MQSEKCLTWGGGERVIKVYLLNQIETGNGQKLFVEADDTVGCHHSCPPKNF